MGHEPSTATEMFKALGDPIRWSILQQIAAEDEFPCSALEETLPVSKPTISYHTKILTQAGLIEVLKRGRNYYYRIQPDALDELAEQVRLLTPGPRLVVEQPATRPVKAAKTAEAAEVTRTGPAKPRRKVAALRKAVGDDLVHGAHGDEPGSGPTVLTW